MFKLLRGSPETTQPTHRGPLDIKRYTRIEPREARTLNQKNYTRFAAAEPKADDAQDYVAAQPKVIVRKLPMPKPSARKTEVSLAEHLHSDAPISIALLRRALPSRFVDQDGRNSRAKSGGLEALGYAYS